MIINNNYVILVNLMSKPYGKQKREFQARKLTPLMEKKKFLFMSQTKSEMEIDRY